MASGGGAAPRRHIGRAARRVASATWAAPRRRPRPSWSRGATGEGVSACSTTTCIDAATCIPLTDIPLLAYAYRCWHTWANLASWPACAGAHLWLPRAAARGREGKPASLFVRPASRLSPPPTHHHHHHHHHTTTTTTTTTHHHNHHRQLQHACSCATTARRPTRPPAAGPELRARQQGAPRAGPPCETDSLSRCITHVCRALDRARPPKPRCEAK